MMETDHPIFDGYQNSANTVTLTPAKDGVEIQKVREMVRSTFRPNIAVQSDGTILARQDNEISEKREWNGRPVPTETSK